MATHRMPTCVGLTNKQIWAAFRAAYPDENEQYLREIHNRWVRVSRQAGDRAR